MKLLSAPLRLSEIIGLSLLAVIFIFLPQAITKQQSEKTPPLIQSTLSLPIQTVNNAPPVTSAAAIYIYDPDSGTVIYEKNSQARFYPASTTKLMTAITALDIFDPDQVLIVRSSKVAGSTAHLRLGDRLTTESLLDALLIDSGNDAAVVLAENSPAGYSGFISQMNRKAQSLGLTGTHFTNASGLVNPDHVTTARDLTVIAGEAINNALIRKIVAIKKITITGVSGKISYSLISTNQLLGLDGVRGLKTGWTPESGECLVSLVERNGHSIIVTLLSSQDRFGDSKQLIDWVYNTFSWLQI